MAALASCADMTPTRAGAARGVPPAVNTPLVMAVLGGPGLLRRWGSSPGHTVSLCPAFDNLRSSIARTIIESLTPTRVLSTCS